MKDEVMQQEGLVLGPVLPVSRRGGGSESLHLHHEYPIAFGKLGYPPGPSVSVGSEPVEKENRWSFFPMDLPVEGEGNGGWSRQSRFLS